MKRFLEETHKEYKQSEDDFNDCLNEAEVSSAKRSYSKGLETKNSIISEKDDVVVYKDVLIAKYKMFLSAQGIEISVETGELILGSIGRRGMAEKYEDDRVRELNIRKINLYSDVDKLQGQKEMLLAELRSLEDRVEQDTFFLRNC